MRIKKAKMWNLLKAAWEYYYPVTIAPAVKDPNFVKADGKTVMTQGEINTQLKSGIDSAETASHAAATYQTKLPFVVKNNMLCMKVKF